MYFILMLISIHIGFFFVGLLLVFCCANLLIPTGLHDFICQQTLSSAMFAIVFDRLITSNILAVSATLSLMETKDPFFLLTCIELQKMAAKFKGQFNLY